VDTNGATAFSCVMRVAAVAGVQGSVLGFHPVNLTPSSTNSHLRRSTIDAYWCGLVSFCVYYYLRVHLPYF